MHVEVFLLLVEVGEVVVATLARLHAGGLSRVKVKLLLAARIAVAVHPLVVVLLRQQVLVS